MKKTSIIWSLLSDVVFFFAGDKFFHEIKYLSESIVAIIRLRNMERTVDIYKHWHIGGVKKKEFTKWYWTRNKLQNGGKN